jgi:hypothetical protein
LLMVFVLLWQCDAVSPSFQLLLPWILKLNKYFYSRNRFWRIKSL